MARTLLTLADAAVSGVQVDDGVMTAAIADGHMVPGDGDIVLIILNSSGSNRTITIPTPGTIAGLAIADVTRVMADGDYWMFGPFSAKQAFVQTDGNIWVDYSSATGVSIIAVRI